MQVHKPHVFREPEIQWGHLDSSGQIIRPKMQVKDFGQFPEGAESLKGLEQGRDVLRRILEWHALVTFLEKSSERTVLGQDVGSTVQPARGT